MPCLCPYDVRYHMPLVPLLDSRNDNNNNKQMGMNDMSVAGIRTCSLIGCQSASQIRVSSASF